jgi:hypothetical protein
VRAALLLLVIPLLPGLLNDAKKELAAAEPAKRVEILEALPARIAKAGAAEKEAIAPWLLSILADPDRVRLHAASLEPLVATGTAGGLAAALVRAYDRDPTPIRAAARQALTTVPGGPVTAGLVDQLGRDESPRARAWLALFLGRRDDPRAGPALVKALADPSPMVRGAAAEGLTRIFRRANGYDPKKWKPVVARGRPAVKPPPEDPKPSKGGATVTKPAPPRDPEKEADRLVPEFYGIPLDRRVVIAVLDFSGSVKGEAARRVRSELERSLSLLPSVRRLSVVAFDERMFTFGSEPRPADPDTKTDLSRFLGDLPAGRRTEMLLPIRTGVALAAKYGKDGAQVLIVSDGMPTADGPPVRDLVDRVEALPEGRVRVDCAVYGGRKVGLFSWLTRQTGGTLAKLPATR